MTGEHVAPTTNDLGVVISSPMVRTAVYAAYVILLVIAGATTAGFGVLHYAFPDWLVVANAVLGYLGIPVGGLAVANTRRTP